MARSSQHTTASRRVSSRSVFRTPARTQWLRAPYQLRQRFVPSERTAVIAEELFNSGAIADGDNLASTNTLFDLFNSPGTSKFRLHPYAGGTLGTTPPYKDAMAEFATDTRVVKDTTSLPGVTNGGNHLREWYYRTYFHLSAAPTNISRITVFEESVAAGGADVCCIRVNTSGAIQLMDGASAGTASTNTFIQTLVRFDWWCNQRGGTQELRMFWGQNVHGPIGSPNETLTYTITNQNPMEVWGLGIYTGPQTSALFRFGPTAVGIGDWIGPEPGSRPFNRQGFGMSIKPATNVV